MDEPDDTRLGKAVIALQCSTDRRSAQEAIHEYLDAKAKAQK